MMAQQSKPKASVAAKAGYRLVVCYVVKEHLQMNSLMPFLRSDAYAEGWDRIFGKKEDSGQTSKVDTEAVASSGAGSSK